MARTSDDPRHGLAKERERIKQCDLSESDTRAALDFMAALDPDDVTAMYRNDRGEQETLAPGSLQDYGRSLRQIGETADADLSELSTEELLEVFNSWDLSDSTIRKRQAAAIKFYRYHDFEVDPEEIGLKKVEDQEGVDERTVLTHEDVDALRGACDNNRDRALIDLLVYTGQRLRAIQTLRIKDIDLQQNVFYLNTDELGLKNADKIGGKRELLGATGAIETWLEDHPAPDDEESYLITALPSSGYNNGPGEQLTKIAIYNRINKLADLADVELPNQQAAHAFRHYFATTAYRDWDWDPSQIKWHMGHAPSSTLFETTYSHLTDEDRLRSIRNKMGMTNNEEENLMTPPKCPRCGEGLQPHYTICPTCNLPFSPDAQDSQKGVQQDVGASRVLAEEDTEAALEEIADSDELLSKLIEIRASKE